MLLEVNEEMLIKWTKPIIQHKLKEMKMNEVMKLKAKEKQKSLINKSYIAYF